MRKEYYIFIASLILFAGVYFFVFEWVVPKTASFTIPQKWRMIPLRESREIVHNYFGEPLPKNNSKDGDIWANGSKGKMYFLRIYYVSDTIALGYSIHYQYKNWFGSRDYLIDSLSIR